MNAPSAEPVCCVQPQQTGGPGLLVFPRQQAAAVPQRQGQAAASDALTSDRAMVGSSEVEVVGDQH